MKPDKNIFITGGTGYIGSRLIPLLAGKGYHVKALIRKGSEHKVKSKCEIITGSPFDADTFKEHVTGCGTFIQLLGVPHPSPAKAKEFREIDLVSIQQSVIAAKHAGVKNFIYLSVAEPAPIMKAYIEVRKEGERLITEAGLNAVFIKPWYILGPGHWWPVIALPVYWLFMLIPFTRVTAKRLYPVQLRQVLNSIVDAVINPGGGARYFDRNVIKNY